MQNLKGAYDVYQKTCNNLIYRIFTYSTDHCGEQLSVLVTKNSAEILTKASKMRTFQNRVPKCCLAGISIGTF